MNERYQRQIILPELGKEGVRKLSEARVLIVGMGGLGCPIALYLATAGVGHLGLIDNDVVSISNLHRQVLYDEADLGLLKAECAARHLLNKNSDIEVTSYPVRLTKENAEEVITKYDIVVDGCDNHATRYLLSDICSKQSKPYVYVAIGAFQGQVAILCHDQYAPTYRTLFPDEKAMCSLQAYKGVIGTTPAVVGSVAAAETIKLITGIGEILFGRLFTINLLTLQSCIITL
ncbi:MAG: HesA/MoeB/ThiF family protein [Mediterranea massiliensis]|nr:HesA/MoeB/ThiF family protein [Mediterranea massiliensis]